MPGNRRGMLRRHSQSKLIALVEHALAILWAVAIVLTLMSSPVALIAIALVAAILAFVGSRHRRVAQPPAMGRATSAVLDTATAAPARA
jgi:hypothetical protein